MEVKFFGMGGGAALNGATRQCQIHRVIILDIV